MPLLWGQWRQEPNPIGLVPILMGGENLNTDVVYTGAAMFANKEVENEMGAPRPSVVGGWNGGCVKQHL